MCRRPTDVGNGDRSDVKTSTTLPIAHQIEVADGEQVQPVKRSCKEDTLPAPNTCGTNGSPILPLILHFTKVAEMERAFPLRTKSRRRKQSSYTAAKTAGDHEILWTPSLCSMRKAQSQSCRQINNDRDDQGRHEQNASCVKEDVSREARVKLLCLERVQTIS